MTITLLCDDPSLIIPFLNANIKKIISFKVGAVLNKNKARMAQ
jgi:hypothetical protein